VRSRDGRLQRHTLSSGSAVLTHLNFDTVFEEHFSFVWRCLRGLGVHAADLDDVTQEVFVIVHRRFSNFEPEIGVRPWLYAILRRVAGNYRRSAKRLAGRHGTLDREPVAAGPDPEQSLETRQAAQTVERLLAKLEPTQREVFLAVELEGLTVPEISAVMQVPLNTTYSRLRLARADFKAALTAKHGSSK
jgi:RNA polymerase sigma-70 factor, ECF subfamily